MLLSNRMALRMAIAHYQNNVSQMIDLSSSPWKCFVNRDKIKRLNALLERDAETISTALSGVKYSDVCRLAVNDSHDVQGGHQTMNRLHQTVAVSADALEV